jgi:hypothetical protein
MDNLTPRGLLARAAFGFPGLDLGWVRTVPFGVSGVGEGLRGGHNGFPSEQSGFSPEQYVVGLVRFGFRFLGLGLGLGLGVGLSNYKSKLSAVMWMLCCIGEPPHEKSRKYASN